MDLVKIRILGNRVSCGGFLREKKFLGDLFTRERFF